jgi:hypothetical protein
MRAAQPTVHALYRAVLMLIVQRQSVHYTPDQHRAERHEASVSVVTPDSYRFCQEKMPLAGDRARGSARCCASAF